MSGVDEQDVMPCDCGRFSYWVIFDDNAVIGYLNPDAWMEKHQARGVSTLKRIEGISKEDFANSITSFRCDSCDRPIKSSCNMFNTLHHSVVKRWDVCSVGH